MVPTRPVGVSVFVEEEGSRFGLACLCSRLAAGAMSWEVARELVDRDGVRLGDVVAGPRGPAGSVAPSWVVDMASYVELHVEQGRDLVDRDAAIGVASETWPHGRYRFDVTGEANHAGTTRMEDRADPMLTYAMTALAANKQARVVGGAGLPGPRAASGRVEVALNGTNAVPARVTAWLDARCASEEALSDLVAAIERQAVERAGRDGTAVEVTAESVSGAVRFDVDLAQAIAADHSGGDWPIIATQAGHDAGILSAAGVPTAMMFVRNPTGISHSPAETASTPDCLVGVSALADTLARLADSPAQGGDGAVSGTAYLLERAWVDEVLVEVEDGRFTAATPALAEVRNSRLSTGTSYLKREIHRSSGDFPTRLPGLTLPGLANCHSHPFHRALRGRTQQGSGTFWTWREQMYAVAQRLDPDTYYALAVWGADRLVHGAL